jgi:16S rRNA (guanine(966)-N(2))-methyltransferase RsmD
MSGLRVIAGTAKGRRLKFVPGDSTRPITDRVKENLFNIIGPEIVGTSFLDLFAGTGGVGIEALSRGADFARFYDLERRAVRTIHDNLEITKLGDRAEVQQRDALVVLANGPDRAFDTIFIAPPQYQELWKQALLALDAQPGWLEATGWVVVQIDPREFEEVELGELELFDRRKYGNTELLFYRLKLQ